jgi:hypothetical protein
MSYRRKTRDEHLFDPGPKRILALDGGGLRGIFSLGLLKEMETLLRERHGGAPDFRLADYFDLMAGTSTGAIIAACLARGMTVEETARYYREMGDEVFRNTWRSATAGIIRPRYDTASLNRYLKDAVGADTRLGDESVRTGLLIVTKRIDTHSVWPLANNPRGQYYDAPEGRPWVPNREFPLWLLLRASAAAPSYFDPEELAISDPGESAPQVGRFIDGGMGPFNDPSLQALMYVSLAGYNLRWPLGSDRLLMVSLGTGAFDEPKPPPVPGPVGDAFRAFFSLMNDNQKLIRQLMQWMSEGPTASRIDGEVGDLSQDLLGGAPLLSYVRYDADLTPRGVGPLLSRLPVKPTPGQLETLHEMDNATNVPFLWEVGRTTGRDRLDEAHFPVAFDIDPAP